MINITDILKKKKLQLFFLFYVLLILPLLTPLAQNVSLEQAGVSLTVNVLLFLALVVFSFFLSPRSEKIIYTVLLIIATIPGAMLLAYLLFARVLLEQNSITSLFETNPEESKEFMLYYLNVWVVGGVLLYIIIPVLMIWRMKSVRPLKIKPYKILFSFSVIAILCVVFVSRLSQSVYFLNFYNTFISYKVRLYNENKEIPNRQNHHYEVIPLEVGDSVPPQTLVLVIGESLSRSHMQLYGYGRQTNPLLSKTENLHAYTDVVSPQVHTIPVIRSLLTFSDFKNPEFFLRKPSLFELFNRAGYETYFIANQSFGRKSASSYDVLLELAQHEFDLSPQKKHDEVLLPQLKEALVKNPRKNKLIVIQLIGNHMAYKFRYPKTYANLFDHTQDGFVKDETYINEEAKKQVDEYDNSVVYNDYVLSSVIRLLSASPNANAAMLYVSDHGEELYDYRNFAGHAYEKVSAYMCEIPFVLWMSPQFSSHRHDLQIDTKRPYSTNDYLYSVSNLAGLQYADYEEERSIFSLNYKPQNRYVGDILYDDLVAKKKK